MSSSHTPYYGRPSHPQHYGWPNVTFEYLNNWSLKYINLVILAIDLASKQIYTFDRCDDWVMALFILVHICV